jgi:drug/metabolite transporter (DMT)-like permease
MSIRRSAPSSMTQFSLPGPDEESFLLETGDGFPLEFDESYTSFSTTDSTNTDKLSSPSSSSSQRSQYHHWNDGLGRRILQSVSLLIFVTLWVVNVEVLQAITTGGPVLGIENHDTYDKPVFVTWYSYNYLILSLLFVMVLVATNKQHFLHNKNTINLRGDRTSCNSSNTTRSISGSILHYIRFTWPGRLGLHRALLSCLLISWMLQFLNVLAIVGLKCISVSLSNALYQSQAVFTLSFSVCMLRDRLAKSQVGGMFVSLLGILWIVLPPLLLSTSGEIVASDNTYPGTTTTPTNDNNTNDGTCDSLSFPVLFGSSMTLLSAIIGGFYLVSWRIFDEKRDRSLCTTSSTKTTQRHGGANGAISTRLDDLVDTQTTLAMIGLCNLFGGWILVVLAHIIGIETLEWPVATSAGSFNNYDVVGASGVAWKLLTLNAGIEYLFDASCAIAIYMTSPLTVAVVSPLTIPLSLLVDRYKVIMQYNTMMIMVQTEGGASAADWIATIPSSSEAGGSVLSSVGGTIVILIGVWYMEAKPE